MFRRQPSVTLGLVVLVVSVLLALPRKTSAQLKVALGTLFLPLVALANATHAWNKNAANTRLASRAAIDRIQTLEHENDRLRLLAQQNDAALRESARLRQHFQFQKQAPWNLRLARVINRDGANWWRAVRIDFGRQHGALPDFPVLTSQGLLGRISEVGLLDSEVVLLGDPNCRVAAMIVESREQGVIIPKSSGRSDPSLVDLTYLPRHAALKAGLHVITSGEGGVFPKGIPIGEILDHRTVDSGLYLEARVKLAADLNRLEEVWVKLP
jgi:rod shape-determining protein MreC